MYDRVNEPDDCIGVEGVTVEVTGANKQVNTMVTGYGGNFSLRASEADLTFPIQARVMQDGRELAVQAHPETGNCANCHTETGEEMALGRILAP